MAIFNLNADEWNEEIEHEAFAFSPAGDRAKSRSR
jgi:hypothetical protein